MLYRNSQCTALLALPFLILKGHRHLSLTGIIITHQAIKESTCYFSTCQAKTRFESISYSHVASIKIKQEKLNMHMVLNFQVIRFRFLSVHQRRGRLLPWMLSSCKRLEQQIVLMGKINPTVRSLGKFLSDQMFLKPYFHV